jgi:hypothetical protein
MDKSGIHLVSPVSDQVFQRETLQEGTIIVSGRILDQFKTLKMHIKGQTYEKSLYEASSEIPICPQTGIFFSRMKTPAGGWYRITIQGTGKGGKKISEIVVDRVGVGEVFVGAGQSNSTNCGELKTSQKSGMISAFDGASWRITDDPFPGVQDGSAGGSYYPAFGDALYEKYGVPVGIASVGYGGTSVNQWQPDGALHNGMMARIQQLGRGGFRGVLWHQGESDCHVNFPDYYEKMVNVIRSSTKKAGWEFPWFVAQATYHNPEKTSDPVIRAAQKRLWDDRIALPGPDTDTLVGMDRDLGGLGIHFSPQGLKNHGMMWAEKVSLYLALIL